jgi:RimJ/RimL family protein N-acetyltransferase
MRGSLVTLRTVLAEDSDYYYQWINNKELVLLNSDFKPVSREEHDRWFTSLNDQQHLALFSIVTNQEQQLIGSCSLRNINSHHKNAELQIRIGDFDYHNRGYGSDAIKLLVQYGFSKLNLHRIYLYVFADNLKAIKAYKKCNFRIEGELEEAACINGKFINLILMAIIKK